MRVSRAIGLVVIALSYTVYALDEESAKEGKCFEIKKTVPVDTNWVGSLKAFYVPALSRLDLYRTATHITGRDFKDITEDELYYDGCINFGIGSDGGFNLNGFNAKNVKLPMRPQDPGLEKFEFGSEEGFRGYCHTVLTDNKTFIMLACCSNGDEMHWAAITAVKVLPKETVKMIHDHAESLGFAKEQFTRLRYDTCDKKVKEEL